MSFVWLVVGGWLVFCVFLVVREVQQSRLAHRESWRIERWKRE